MCVWAYVCMVYGRMCVWVYVCMGVCVYVCMCVPLPDLNKPNSWRVLECSASPQVAHTCSGVCGVMVCVVCVWGHGVCGVCVHVRCLAVPLDWCVTIAVCGCKILCVVWKNVGFGVHT